MDLTNWIVMQGRAYYVDVLRHPERIPPTVPVRGRSFLSAIFMTYQKRFGQSVPDEPSSFDDRRKAEQG